jgi:hypothetical protein
VNFAGPRRKGKERYSSNRPEGDSKNSRKENRKEFFSPWKSHNPWWLKTARRTMPSKSKWTNQQTQTTYNNSNSNASAKYRERGRSAFNSLGGTNHRKRWKCPEGRIVTQKNQLIKLLMNLMRLLHALPP